MNQAFMADKLVVIGSASVHTWRYVAGIAPHVREIWLASNAVMPEERRPANLAGFLQVDFGMLNLSTVPRLAGWLRSLSPDVVHVHQANSVAWHARRALRGMQVPMVLTAWGSDVLLLPGRNAWYRHMVRANLRAATRITSDSLHMAACIRALAGESVKIDCLNFGMDALPPAPVSGSKPKRILSCRLHKPLYRIDRIIDAWAMLEARWPDWSLTVAASGDQTDALKARVAAKGLQRVTFTGFIPAAELAMLYRDSRIFVSVPASDATSISLLEAMGHGCLPVLSNLPANGEWVIDGLNGYIAEDPARLSVTLEQAMQTASDDGQLDDAAMINRRLVSEKGLHQPNMQRFARIYREVLGKGNQE